MILDSRLREGRLRRIARYKTRLALLLPPMVDPQLRSDIAPGTWNKILVWHPVPYRFRLLIWSCSIKSCYRLFSYSVTCSRGVCLYFSHWLWIVGRVVCLISIGLKVSSFSINVLHEIWFLVNWPVLWKQWNLPLILIVMLTFITANHELFKIKKKNYYSSSGVDLFSRLFGEHKLCYII